MACSTLAESPPLPVAPHTIDGDVYLDIEDVAGYCSVSTKTILRWMRTEGFPRSRWLAPKTQRWSLSSVRAWLDSRPTSREGVRRAS